MKTLICFTTLTFFFMNNSFAITGVLTKSEAYKTCLEQKYRQKLFLKVKNKVSILLKKNKKLQEILPKEKKKNWKKLKESHAKLVFKKYLVEKKIDKINLEIVKSGCPEQLLEML